MGTILTWLSRRFHHLFLPLLRPTLSACPEPAMNTKHYKAQGLRGIIGFTINSATSHTKFCAFQFWAERVSTVVRCMTVFCCRMYLMALFILPEKTGLRLWCKQLIFWNWFYKRRAHCLKLFVTDRLRKWTSKPLYCTAHISWRCVSERHPKAWSWNVHQFHDDMSPHWKNLVKWIRLSQDTVADHFSVNGLQTIACTKINTAALQSFQNDDRLTIAFQVIILMHLSKTVRAATKVKTDQ